MEHISQYILSIVAVAIISSIAITLTEKNTTVTAPIKLLSGIILAITVIKPVTGLNIRSVEDYIGSIQADASAAIADGKSFSVEEESAIIKQNVEAYILDKATELGIAPQISVTLTESDPPVPCAVTLSGSASPYVRNVLQSFIETDLGIPKEQQIWK